jgi:hypothetical protein
MGSMTRRRRLFTLAVLAVATVPASARAQSGGPGFLFQQPYGTFSLRTGWAVANAGSDLFAFTTEQLTLDRGDFSSMALDADLAMRVASRTRLVLSLSVAGTHKRSEFREYEDTDNLPIEQTTSFSRVPVIVGVRQYLTSPGRAIGRFAWIPAKIAPYVGAGGGLMYYRFHQSGDFVDYQTLDIFRSQLTSDGWTPVASMLAGLEYSLGARVALNVESRYLWSNADPSGDFVGFDRLDLSGVNTTVGLSVRLR